MEEVIGSIPLGSTISLSNDRSRLARLSARRSVEAFGSTLAAAWMMCVSAVLPEPATAEEARAVRPAAAAGALVADLRARILGADSATAVLEAWCVEQGFAREGRLVALRQAGAEKALSADQRIRLGVGPDEPVRYRHVRLACGGRILSEADNWYVPARLTPEMNAVLDGSDAPFGRVVRPLLPARRVVSVQTFPLPENPGPDSPLVSVDAVLVTGTGEPFCEVVETYLGAALPVTGR